MVARVNDAQGPADWFQALPAVTRYWFGLSLIITVAGNMGIVSPRNFIFSFEAIKSDFEVWRLLTCFCYAGRFEFPTLITLYMLFTFSQQYEKGGPFNTGAGGGTADYAFAMLFGMVMMILTYYPVSLYLVPLFPLFTKNLIYFVLYIWSKNHPNHQANIWGIPVQGMYLPFAYAAITVFMGGSIYDLCHGMGIGHIYYFLVDVVPQVYGKDVLQTPQFLIDQLGVGEFAPAAVQAQAPGRAQPFVRPAPRAADNNNAPQRGHQWGAGGQRLGGT